MQGFWDVFVFVDGQEFWDVFVGGKSSGMCLEMGKNSWMSLEVARVLSNMQEF